MRLRDRLEVVAACGRVDAEEAREVGRAGDGEDVLVGLRAQLHEAVGDHGGGRLDVRLGVLGDVAAADARADADQRGH